MLAVVGCTEKAMLVARPVEIHLRRIGVSVVEIEPAVVDVGDAGQVMARWLKAGREGIVVGPAGCADRAVGGEEEEAVVPQRNAGFDRRVPDVAAGVGDVGDARRAVLEDRVRRRGNAVFIARGESGGGVAVVGAFVVELSPAMGIAVRNVAGDVRVGHALRAPRPAVAADFTAGI